MIRRSDKNHVIVAKRRLRTDNDYFQDRLVRYPVLKSWPQGGTHHVFLPATFE